MSPANKCPKYTFKNLQKIIIMKMQVNTYKCYNYIIFNIKFIIFKCLNNILKTFVSIFTYIIVKPLYKTHVTKNKHYIKLCHIPFDLHSFNKMTYLIFIIKLLYYLLNKFKK